MAALVDKRIDSMFEFIETHAGITYRNLQLFYGDLILELGANEATINRECVTRGKPMLSEETEDSDYIFEAPINAFDGGGLVPLTPQYVAGIIAKVKKLPPLSPIELNKPTTDFSDYLPISLDDFRGSIPKLQTTYTKIKGNEKTSKVREMLEDFQPMFLERYSNFVLDLLKTTDDERVFTTMTEFIRAFTEDEFAALVAQIDPTAGLVQMKPSETVWEGKFGMIHLIIHVVPKRQPTGKGNTISAANVIQAAVFYKDRKNDFVRGQGALTMIKDCKTRWPRGDISHKNGINYRFSDLYTGELIVQDYTGTLPDFPDYSNYAHGIKVKVKDAPYVIHPDYYNDAFVSVLPIVHEASAAKKIFTNQEHIFAVYPASCAFENWCYYETLIQNLQMISAIANSEVNYETYESPLGKIQFLYDSHETNLKKNIGPWWAKRLELFITAMRVCPTMEFHDALPGEAAAFQSKITEIAAENAKNAPRLDFLTKSSKTKDELKEFVALTQLKQTNDFNLGILRSLPVIKDVPSVPDNAQFVIAKKKYIDFISYKEFHTRKAMVMKRLATLEECALDYDANVDLITHRRSVVMSCIHSVGIIVECAKIGVATTTVSTSQYQKLVSESKNVTALRKLSARLFSDYQKYKVTNDVPDEIVESIELMLQVVETHDTLKSGIKIVLVDNVTLRYKGVWADLLYERGIILQRKLDELDLRVAAGEDYQVVRMDQEERYKVMLTEINGQMVEAIANMDRDYSNVSYLLENLSELGAVHSVNLFQTASKMNGLILQILNKLLTVPSIFDPVQKARMARLLQMITQPDPSTVLVTHHTERDEKEKEVVVEKFGNGLKENVNTVHGLLPEGVSYKSAVNVAMTLIGNAPEPKPRKKGLSYNDREIVAQAMQAKDESYKSTPTANRLSQRLLRIAAAKKADDAQHEMEVTKRTKEADALEGLLYMYNFTNEPKKPSEEMRSQIIAEVNSNAEVAKAAADLMSIMEKLAGPFQLNTTGKLSLVEKGLPVVQPYHLSPFGARGGGIDNFADQMNAAIERKEIPTMYDLYIDHFDSEENDYDTCILLNQAYCILMKHDIYVPLYRCHATKTVEEMIEPMLEKRREYRGDFYDFDSTFADSFCIQLFGKNVNELLDDLSKGSLNVPRGAFPNISANPFDPVSLICILETVLFLCKGLPFATRLHVYFSGMLSFMGQTYDRNMDEIQTGEILSLLESGNFFYSFHAAARMYNERYGRLSKPDASEVTGELAPEELAPVPPEELAPVPPAPTPESDPNTVATQLYKDKRGDYGGTRRYRKKTKRQTLNKRFKKHRTRRLHGVYVRE